MEQVNKGQAGKTMNTLRSALLAFMIFAKRQVISAETNSGQRSTSAR